MPEFSTLIIFIGSALIFLVIPGPSVLYIVTRSMDQGRLAGFVSALGIQVGTLFHVAAAAFGLSALILSSALAFNALKYLGAIYLIYLGIRKLFIKEEFQQQNKEEQKELTKQNSLKRVFGQAVIVNILNPKTALFFLAFLPQFIDTSKGSVIGQFVFLGLILAFMGVCSDSLYALIAGSVRPWLKGNSRFLRNQRYFTGSIYFGLGVATALSGINKK